MMKPRLAAFLQTTLASSIAVMFAPAMAQQAAPAPAAAASAPSSAASAPGSAASAPAAAGATSLNSVTVTGYRASIQRALEVKRNSNSIVDAISAEDIGKFPDRNAAESLAHLPGVSVDRLYGEGEKVSINGTDPALNRVLINGQTIASGDWGGAPGDTSGRTFNYTLLAPEIIGLMEVYKTPEARIDEGSIGGTVIIHTRKPLDLPANTLRGSLGYLYNDRSQNGDPRGSMLYSWKNEGSTLGALVAVSRDKQRLSQASVQFFGYDTGNGISPTARVTGSGDVATARLPVAIDSSVFDQQRTRDSVQGALQWKLDPRNEINLTGIYVRGKYDNFSQSRYVLPCCDKGRFTDVTVNNGLITAGTIVPAAGQAGTAQLDANYRESTIRTRSINLSHEYTVEGWKLRTQAGYTDSSGGKNREYLMKYLLRSGGYSFNYGEQSAGVTYDNGAASNWGLAAAPLGSPPGTYSIGGQFQAGGIASSVSSDDERYGQIDLTHDVDWGPVKEVLFGVKYLNHKNGNKAFGNRINTTSAITLDQFSPTNVPSSLFSGLQVNGDITNWATPDSNAVRSYLENQPQGSFGQDLNSTFLVTEVTKNLYTQFNYELAGGLRGNFGLRYVDTTDEANYFLSNDGFTTFNFTQTDTSYRRVLPSFNLAYDIDDSKTVRFSVAKVLARPRYANLAAASERNDQQLSGSGGNPDLKPYEAVNFDVAGEWYFAPRSLLGAEFFYRDIKNYVVNVAHDEQLFNPLSGRVDTYSISSPVNGDQAKVRGISLLYQQDLAYGFGITTNYTHTRPTANESLNLPYLSRNNYNLIPYYEQGPWSARFVYSWRSKYFTAVGRRNSQDFTDKYRQLDFSASYEVNKNVSVAVGASNLLDETYYQFSSVKDAPTGIYKNGRIITVGLNFKL